jgi:hypothetical protein
MFRKDVLSRYKNFLNEVLEGCAQGGGFRGMPELREKYGVSSTLITYLNATGIIHREGRTWVSERIELYEDAEVGMLISSFNKWKREKGKPPQLSKDADSDNNLIAYSTKELLTELKRRGYSGTLTITKEVKL